MFYVDPHTAAARWVAANPTDPRAPIIRSRIAAVPQGRWFTTTNTPTIRAEIDTYLTEAAGTTPIMVIYNMPDRDNGGASSGGAASHTAYRAWIDELAAALADRAAVIILEPDILCLSPNPDVLASLAYAGKQLRAGSSLARIYLDAGHSAWLPADVIAARLVAAGIASGANGISLNVSNYRHTHTEIPYAKAVIAATGVPGLSAIIDTSRNGNGPLGSEWCDPVGRAIGVASTTSTDDPVIDAYLWVKLPGEADGCLAPAGEFVPQRAYDLAVG